MKAVEHMYQAVEFIENNLREQISVKIVSDAVESSLYHFTRTFSDIVGHSPYDYIMRRRLSQAALDVQRSDKKIIDIAFDYQFNSPETFSRAFRKMFGVLPNEARKTSYFEPVGFKVPVEFDYLKYINDKKPGAPVIEQRNDLMLAGVPFKMSYCQNYKTTILRKFEKELTSMQKYVNLRGFYLVTVYPYIEDEYPIFHMLAVQTTPRLHTPGYLTGKLLPESSYARFAHNGGGRELRMTLDYIFQTWLPKSGHSIRQSIAVQNLGDDYKGLLESNWQSDVLVPLA